MSVPMLVVLLVILVLVLPVYPYSRSWGYVPSSGLLIVLIILALLLFSGRL